MNASHVRTAGLCLTLLAAGCGRAGAPPGGLSSPALEPFAAGSRVFAEVLPAEPDDAHPFPVRIRLANEGQSDLLVFQPLDGSDYGRHLPYYRFEVTGVGGRVPFPDVQCGTSGLWADTTWPASYAVKLRPGESFERKMDLPQISEPGTYRVRFTYEYRIDDDAQASFPTPPGAWVGVAEAPEVVVTFATTRPGE